MHKVANIRDFSLRAGLPPEQRWSAYRRDIESLLESSLEGGLASVHSSDPSRRHAA